VHILKVIEERKKELDKTNLYFNKHTGDLVEAIKWDSKSRMGTFGVKIINRKTDYIVTTTDQKEIILQDGDYLIYNKNIVRYYTNEEFSETFDTVDNTFLVLRDFKTAITRLIIKAALDHIDLMQVSMATGNTSLYDYFDQSEFLGIILRLTNLIELNNEFLPKLAKQIDLCSLKTNIVLQSFFESLENVAGSIEE
jgi:hypothetical protein